MLLASCSYEESKKYNSKIVVKQEETSNKKSKEVLLNIVTDNPDEVLRGGIGVAKCVTTTVSPSFCPNSLEGDVFRVYNYGDNLEEVENEVNGVVPLLVLPSGFCDMREVCNLMSKYPTLRVTGGNLLEIPGVRIGRYDKGKEKMSSVFNGIYDIFKEVELDSISVQRVVSKAKSKSSSSKGSSKGSTKKTSSKSGVKETLNKFFGGMECEF